MTLKIGYLTFARYPRALALLGQQTHELSQHSLLEQLPWWQVPLLVSSPWVWGLKEQLPLVHVLEEGKRALALAWLSYYDTACKRLRLDELILAATEEAPAVGKHLLDFLSSHYGAQGVETLLAFVEADNEEAMRLLSNAGFSQMGLQQRYLLEPSPALSDALDDTALWREATDKDVPLLAALHHDSLPVVLKPFLGESRHGWGLSFRHRLTLRYRGWWARNWLLSRGGQVVASFELRSKDFRHFIVKPQVSLHQQGQLLPDVLAMALFQAQKNCHNPTLEVLLYSNLKEGEAQPLKAFQAKELAPSLILVRDIRTLLKAPCKPNLKAPILLLGGHASPACYTLFES
jgi:hypothetical protein